MHTKSMLKTFLISSKVYDRWKSFDSEQHDVVGFFRLAASLHVLFLFSAAIDVLTCSPCIWTAEVQTRLLDVHTVVIGNNRRKSFDTIEQTL